MKEYGETVEYIHGNPVRRGYVSRPEAWRWSSAKEYLESAAASNCAPAYSPSIVFSGTLLAVTEFLKRCKSTDGGEVIEMSE